MSTPRVAEPFPAVDPAPYPEYPTPAGEPSTGRAVLFDMDGVLLESRAGWLALMNRLAAERGCAPISAEALARSWGQDVAMDAVEFYGGADPIWVEQASTRYVELLLAHVDACAGAAELTLHLDATGVPWAIVTNTPRALALPMLERASLGRARLLCAGTAGAPKPSPELLLAGCAQMGVAPSEAWMVGDTPSDATAAACAGIAFVGIGDSLRGCRTFGGLDQVRAFLDGRLSWVRTP